MRLLFRRDPYGEGFRQRRRDPAVLLSGLLRHHEVALLVLLGLLVRLYDFNAPYISHHWIKQLQIAPIAKNFATKNPNILWPETDYSADRPGYIEIEFQLVTWLAALLYHVFGIHEWVGRLVTVSFSVGSMVLLYRLVLMYLGPIAAAYALFFFAFAPSNWYFSRALMSEPAMLFFSIALVYSFSRWLQSPTPARFAWTGLAGALCFLVKLPTTLLLIPLAYLAYTHFGKRVWRQHSLWLLGAIMLAPAVAYYLHARYNIGEHYFTVGVGFGGSMWFSPEHFLRPGNYSLMAQRLVKDHLTPVGVVLLLLGLCVAHNARQWRLTVFHVWVAAVALYMVVVSGGNVRQNYYQLHLIPPAAALVGLAWEQLTDSARFVRQLKPALAGLFLAFAVWGVQPMFEQYTPILRAAQELNALDPQRRPVIIFPAGFGCLYYFNRPGWVGREGMGKPPSVVAPEDVPGPEYVQDRIRRGARWAVYFDVKTHEADPAIQQYLRANYLCVHDTQDYQIFDLSRKPDPRGTAASLTTPEQGRPSFPPGLGE